MKLSFTLMLFLSFSCFGQTDETRKIDYQIDWKYKGGEYFIFDCERSHYACVNIDGFNNCKEERNFAIETKATGYPCAPLRKFKDKKSCVEKNYQVVDTKAIKRFCYPK